MSADLPFYIINLLHTVIAKNTICCQNRCSTKNIEKISNCLRFCDWSMSTSLISLHYLHLESKIYQIIAITAYCLKENILMISCINININHKSFIVSSFKGQPFWGSHIYLLSRCMGTKKGVAESISKPFKSTYIPSAIEFRKMSLKCSKV